MVGGSVLAGEAVIGRRAFDEIISDDVELMIGGGMSANQTADAPIADDVVDVLNRAFGLGIAALIVDPKIVRVSDVGRGIGERTEALRVNAFADDAVLESDVVAALRDAETIPASPFDAAMVKNHVAAAGKIDGTFSFVAFNAFAETQITNDDVARTAEGNGTSVKNNAVAGRRLAENGDVAADGNVRGKFDDAANVEDDEAFAFVDGIAERAGTGIVQVRDVINFTVTSAGGQGAKTFRAGKSQFRANGRGFAHGNRNQKHET